MLVTVSTSNDVSLLRTITEYSLVALQLEKEKEKAVQNDPHAPQDLGPLDSLVTRLLLNFLANQL